MQKKSHILIVLIIAVSIQISDSSASESYINDLKKNIVSKIQTNIYQDDYTDAVLFADSLIANYPNEPIGYLFKAAVLLSEMTDRETNLYPDEFSRLIDTTMIIVDSEVTAVDSNTAAWYYLFEGHAQAYLSLYETRFGSMTSAIKNGFRAKSSYHKGLEQDSTVYDLYGGLGMYHYWKSAKAGFLKWIKVLNDDKEKGIQELHIAKDSSVISSDAAKASLIWIYLNDQKYDTALTIAKEMYDKYPDGKTFLWAFARIYYADAQYEKAIDVFQLLYDKLMQNRQNYYNIIESEYYIYQAYLAMGDEKKAKEIAYRSLYYVNKISMDVRDRQRDKIEKLVQAATS